MTGRFKWSKMRPRDIEELFHMQAGDDNVTEGSQAVGWSSSLSCLPRHLARQSKKAGTCTQQQGLALEK